MNYTAHFNVRQTPQSESIPGESMISNAAGGYVYQLDKWKVLRRFLILGTEGGTYYASEKKLTQKNAKTVIECIKEEASRVVNEILTVSELGLAPKNDAAIFCLALVCAFAEKDKRKFGYEAITKVCRTGTHLFAFCEAIQALRGWSRGLRQGVAKFYEQENTPYQLVKYRQRNGWTHRDVLRLCHAKPKTGAKEHILGWAVGSKKKILFASLPPVIKYYESISNKTEIDFTALDDIKHLPWEAIPTQFLKDKRVWEALLPTMPLTALMRNLNKFSLYAGVDSNLSEHARFVAERFNAEAVHKARLHPLKVLEAMKIYAAGRGVKGSLTWRPAPIIIDALNEAFYLAFKNVAPTGKRFMIGLDVSGSMTSPISGSFLSCAEVAAAMCMQIARTEKSYEIIAFADQPRLLNIHPGMSLPDVLRMTMSTAFGATDCSLPIRYALEQKKQVDAFQILTDSETWAGNIHPTQALRQYRSQFNLEAKMVVWGMTATECSIADSSDPGMLDVAGFDSSNPEIIRSFLLS